MKRNAAWSRLVAVGVAMAVANQSVSGQCPEEPALQNWTGAGNVTCPCFVAGEEAGAIFDLPAGDFPIEILRVQIGWGSQFGGNPDQLEGAINIYPAGLPNPGVPQFSVAGPVLTDGFLNEFDLTLFPGDRVITSGPFTVTLEFLNDSVLSGPSVVHDGNGCQPGKNVVFATPGSWFDACNLGVSGDWVFSVVYRPVNCPVTDCEEVASAVNYGIGHPGTNGVPDLLAVTDPVVGSDLELFIGNSANANAVGIVFIGTQLTFINGSWGGPLLVQPSLSVPLPVLPAAGIDFTLSIDDDPGLCGAILFMQLLQSDAGASKGISSSLGLQLNFGS